MAHELSLPAVRVKQKDGDKELFVTSLKASELIDQSQFKINYWDSEKKNTEKNGYQRKPSPIRVDKIARFVAANNSFMPTSILINSQDEDGITFRGENEGSNFGHIKLNKYPMWVIDGQHRIEGIRYAINKFGEKTLNDYELPVVFMSNFNEMEELNQFNILNTTQKKVSTDLAQRLMQIKAKSSDFEYNKLVSEGTEWQVKALPVIDLLNEKPGSPWFRQIKLPNEDRKPSHIINQNSLLQSLRPVFKDGYFKRLNNVDLEYEAIKNYWLALHQLFPDAFAVRKNYVIQKTPGVFSLHALLRDILLDDQSIDQQSFYKTLSHVFNSFGRGSDYWRADYKDGAGRFGSMKGFRLLAEEFSNRLPKNDLKVSKN